MAIDRALLADPVGAVLGLDHDPWRPVQLGEDDGAGGGEGETHACGCDAEKCDSDCGGVLEEVDVLVALFGGDFAVDPHEAELALL